MRRHGEWPHDGRRRTARSRPRNLYLSLRDANAIFPNGISSLSLVVEGPAAVGIRVDDTTDDTTFPPWRAILKYAATPPNTTTAAPAETAPIRTASLFVGLADGNVVGLCVGDFVDGVFVGNFVGDAVGNFVGAVHAHPKHQPGPIFFSMYSQVKSLSTAHHSSQFLPSQLRL